MNNFSSYCELTDARMRASEKDLPVIPTFIFHENTPSEKVFKIWYVKEETLMMSSSSSDVSTNPESTYPDFFLAKMNFVTYIYTIMKE